MSWFFSSKKEAPKEEIVETLQTEVKNLQSKLEQLEKHQTRMYYDGSMYTGELKDETPHGKGIMYYNKDGSRYVGEWVDGKYNGKGVLYSHNHLALFAHWKDHMLHGDVWYHEGPVMKYENGVLIA